MLKTLHIENYILIDNLNLTLENGLNIITGETGAGKSILLGAISLILGERADNRIIKNSSHNCVLEATFNIENSPKELHKLLKEKDIDESTEINIRRVISPSKSRAFIDDIPINLSFLKNISPLLIDIHSQHQTLLVGDSSFQIRVVDSVAKNDELLFSYNKLFNQINSINSEINKLKLQIEKNRQEEEYIRFQYEQLNDANLIENEDEELEKEFEILSNTTQISQTLNEVNFSIGEQDESIISILQNNINKLSKISTYIDKDNEIVDNLNSSLIDIKENYRTLEKIQSEIYDDPIRLQTIGERIDTISSLQHKHHKNSVKELIDLKNEFESKLDNINNSGFDLESLENKKNIIIKDASNIAKKISERRKKCKKKIEKTIISFLYELGMEHSKFEVSIEDSTSLLSTGKDIVSFLFSGNKDIALEKISKVASGGEMSRLMLALKMLISNYHNMPTMIFDEIDTGVSGRVADKMGEIMVKLADKQQIINITHLPQVASKGEHHFFVYKNNDTKKTNTDIILLTPEQRIEQIAIMLSGNKITNSAISQAKELLAKKQV